MSSRSFRRPFGKTPQQARHAERSFKARQRATRSAERFATRMIAFRERQRERVQKWRELFRPFVWLNRWSVMAMWSSMVASVVRKIDRLAANLRGEATTRLRHHFRRGLFNEGLEERVLLAADINGITPGAYNDVSSGLDTATTTSSLPTISGTVENPGGTVLLDFDGNSALDAGDVVLVEGIDYTGTTWSFAFTTPITSSTTVGAYEGGPLGFQAGQPNALPQDIDAASVEITVEPPAFGAIDILTSVSTDISDSAVGGSSSSMTVGKQSVSADGRYVVFVSDASDLVPGDTNGVTDVFRLDRQTGEIVLVSVNSDNTGPGNRTSRDPVISADGSVVAFESDASDLVANDTNGFGRDVFVRTLSGTPTTTLVSVTSGNTGSGNGSSYDPDISADGSVVAFESRASDLVPNDSNGHTDVFVRTITGTPTTTLVSINSGNTGSGNSFSRNPVINADGSVVAFESYASDLVANDANGRQDVFARTITGTPTTTLVSVNSANTGSGNSFSGDPAISADGSVVAFESLASDLVANDSDADVDVFARTITGTPTTTLVSVNSGNTGSGNDGSFDPVISADGSVVAFVSRASDLVTNDSNGDDVDVFVRTIAGTPATTLVSVNSDNTGSGNFRSQDPVISADGTVVAFESLAGDLVANDVNGVQDVFTWTRSTSQIELVSKGDGTISKEIAVGGRSPSVSADGRYVAFTTSRPLVPLDKNLGDDVYRYDRQTGQVLLVSVNSGQTGAGNSASRYPAISADGAVVAFQSYASDLAANDANGTSDVFARTITGTPTTALISVNSDNTGSGNSISQRPVISADGTVVAFESIASDLVANDANGRRDVFARTITGTPTTTLVSVNSGNTGSGNSGSYAPVISADGSVVAFTSYAGDLVANDANGNLDVFARTITGTPTTTLVSVNSGNTGSGNYRSFDPVISADGSVVAFTSYASDLVANDNNQAGDIFARTITGTPTTTLLSVNSGDTGSGNSGSSYPTISADGSVIAFQSYASDLVANDANGRTDVFARTITGTPTTTLVSVNSGNTGSGNSDSYSYRAVISGNGSTIVFESYANDLVENDDQSSSRNLFISSANTDPIISDQSFSVPEDDDGIASFGTVIASDDESAVRFAIIGGTGANEFEIDENTGELNVKTGVTLDFETQREYTLDVEVTDDDGLTASALMTVEVADVAETIEVGVAAFTAGNGHVTVLKAAGTGPDGEDQIVFQDGNGQPVGIPAHVIGNVAGINVTGRDNASDRLTIDLDNLGSSGVDGVSIAYHGGSGTGTDILELLGDGQSVVYTPDATTFGDGVVQYTGGPTITFTGLEPVDISGMANVTIASPANAANALVLDAGFDSATGTVPTIVVSGNTGLGGTLVETAHLSNNTNVTIDTSATTASGANTITVSTALTNAHGNQNLALVTNADGSVTVDAAATASGTINIDAPTVTLNANLTATGGLSGTATTINVNAGGVIQDGIDVASTTSTGTVNIATGTFAENLSVDKAVTLTGSGSGAGGTRLEPTGGRAIQVTTLAGGQTVTISAMQLSGDSGGTSGIFASDQTSTLAGTLTIDDVRVEGFSSFGLAVFGDSLGSPTNPSTLTVNASNSTFAANGVGAGGDGDLIFWSIGDIALSDLTVSGNSAPNPAENGIQFRADTGSLGTVSLTNVTIDGAYEKVPLAFYNFDDVDGLSGSNVVITADSTSFQISGNFDGIDGDINLATLGIDNSGAPDPFAIQANLGDNALTGNDDDNILRGGVGDDTLVGGDGTDVAVVVGVRADYTVGVTTDPQGRVIGFTSVQDDNPAPLDEGTDSLDGIEQLAFSDTVLDLSLGVQQFNSSGDLVATFATIQAAIDASSSGDTIRVFDGTYTENVTIPNGAEITLQLAGMVDGDFDGNDDSSTLMAIGDLSIGDSSSTAGFAHDGTLMTGGVKVTIGDQNTASLGVLTQVGAGGEIEADNGLNLSSGDTLTGEGTVDGEVNLFTGTVSGNLTIEGPLDGSQASGGTVSPGFSPGTLSTGDLTLSAADTLNIEVDGVTTAGTDYDRINVTGTVTLDGTLDFTGSTVTSSFGDSVIIIANDGIDPVAGAFAGIANNSIVSINGENWLIRYDGGDGNDVELISAATAPTITYVDDDWAGTPIGADPDGAGPATAFGFDAFITIQAGIDALTAGGDVIIYDHAGTGYNEALTIASASIDLLAAASNAPVVDGTGLFGSGLTITGMASVVTVDGLSFINHFSDGIASDGDLTLNSVTIDGGFNGLLLSGGSAELNSTTITNAGIFGISVGGGATLDMHNSEVSGSANAGVIVTDGSATIDESRLSGNDRGLLVSGTGAATVHRSDLSGNTTKAVENATGTVVDAAGNWWGSNVATTVEAATTGLIDFTPFLDNGTDTDGGAVGFVGDFSTLNVTALGQQLGGGPRIQEAIDDVAMPTTVKVHDGTYDEVVSIDRTLNLLSVNPQGASIAPTSGAQQSVISIDADNVTIDGFAIQVNQNDDAGLGGTAPIAPVGIAAVQTDFDGLTINNSVITSIGDNASVNWTGSPSLSVRGAGIVLIDDPAGGIPSVNITDNDVQILSGTSFFQRGVWLAQLQADISGNTFAGAGNDLIFQFPSGGTSTIGGTMAGDENNFIGAQITGGAGLNISDPNANSPVDVINNIFAPVPVETAPSSGVFVPNTSLQVNRNANGDTSPITIQGNVFTGHSTGIDIGGATGMTIDTNAFTASANFPTFAHITFDTQNASNNASNATPFDLTVTNNLFNGEGTAVGTALALTNDLAGSSFGAITVGGIGNENTFTADVDTFILLDAAGAGGPVDVDFDASQNNFDTGTGSNVAANLDPSMTADLAELFAIEDRIDHALDTSGLGVVTINGGHQFVTVNSGSIQRGVDAADAADTVHVQGDTTYDEVLVVNKTDLTLDGDDAGGVGNAPELTRSSGTQQTLITIDATGVTVRDMHLTINQNDGGGAPIAPVGIAAPLTDFDGLTIQDNVISSIGDNSTPWSGSPSSIRVDAAGIVLYDNPGGGIPTVAITDNDVQINSGSSFFQRAVWLAQLNGSITGNTLAGAANDILFQFASGDTTSIDNNNFVGEHRGGGAGLNISGPNASAPINVTNNTFAPTGGDPFATGIQINQNGEATSPITIDNNMFTGETIGVSVGNAIGTEISNNTFTPTMGLPPQAVLGGADFFHVVVDSQSPSAGANPALPIDADIHGNTFNAATGSEGNAIVVADTLPGTFAAAGVQIGVNGVNTYNAGLTTGILVAGGMATITDTISTLDQPIAVSGGEALITGTSLTGSGSTGTGISVSGTGSASILNSTTTGFATGVEVDGGTALLEGNVLTANTVGIHIANDGVVDAGQDQGGAPIDFTGLGSGSGTNGSSVGGNALTGYNGTSTLAIDNDNLDASGNVDVFAEQNDFGSNVLAVIDVVVDHTFDDSLRTEVFFSQSPTLAVPTPVYVDADWAGTALGADPDGAAGAGFLGIATNFGVDAFATIQDAIDAVGSGGEIIVFYDEYDENVLVNKSVTLTAEADPDNPGDLAADVTNTTGSGNTVFLITADDVTIDGFTVTVDQDFVAAGIVATNVDLSTGVVDGSTFNNLLLLDNTVTSINKDGVGDASFAIPTFSPATGVGVAVLGRGGAIESVTIQGNTVDVGTGGPVGLGGASIFARGVWLTEVQATIGGTLPSEGNTLSGLAQDLLVQFASGGATDIENNTFTLAGVDISGPNASSPVNITDNLFDIQSELFTQSLLIRAAHDASSPVTVSGNSFTGHTTGVALDNSSAVTIDGNAFTPSTLAVDYAHIVLDTNRFDSTSVGTLQSVGAIITDNTFNGDGTAIGTAIRLTDSNTVSAPAVPAFGTVTLGGAGVENTFAVDLTNFIVLDPNGAGGAVDKDLEAKDNLFDVGGGPVLPSGMSLADQFALEDGIVHAVDVGSLGFVNVVDGEVFVTANSFFAPNTTAASIQRGADAADAGELLHVQGSHTYDETVVVNKMGLTIDGDDDGGSGTAPVLTRTAGTQQVLMTIDATGVTVRDMHLTINQHDGGGAAVAPVGISAVTTAFDGLSLVNNTIDSIGDNSVDWSGSPNLETDAAGIVLYGFGATGTESITLSDNDIQIASGSSFFQRAVWLTALNGNITGNTIAGANNDILLAAASGGTTTIDDNDFVGQHRAGGAGLYISGPSAASPINVMNNDFAASPGDPNNIQTGLQINQNPHADSPITIDNNTFTNDVIGVSVGNAIGTVVSNNTFTAPAGPNLAAQFVLNGADFAHVVFDSQSPSAGANPSLAIDGKVHGNTFSPGAGASGVGVGVADTLPGTFSAAGIEIGVDGANTYNPGLGTAVGVAGGIATITDNLTGADIGVAVTGGTANLVGSTLTGNTTGIAVSGTGTLTVGAGNTISGGTTGLLLDGAGVGLTGLSLNDLSIQGQSGDYITLTNMALDDLDIDGTGLTLDGTAVSSMTNAQLFAAEDNITHEIDDNAVGFISLVSGTLFVTPVSTPTATNNDYTLIRNAIEAAAAGDTILLGKNLANDGVFNWDEPNALASWELGNDDTPATDDDFTVLLPAGLNDVTVTADNLAIGDADRIEIQGPGDVTSVDLEGVFVAFDNTTNTGWTFENIDILDFDNAIGFYFSVDDDFSNLTVQNMHIRVAADSATDAFQNIGIHYGLGQNISIVNNLIELEGSGDGATIGIQSNTHGGANYEGLNISGNDVAVLNAGTEFILGIWENGHAHGSNITLANNTFQDLDPDNSDTVAFRITSHSSTTTTVEYSANNVDNTSVAFDWLDVFGVTPQDYTGTLPVVMTNNVVTNSDTAFDVGGINGSASITGGSVTGASGIGVDVAADASATVSGVTLQNLDIAIRVGGSATISGNFFDNANDNLVDVQLLASATAITMGASNQFGGDNYFIENLSALDIDLTATSSTFDETSNFRIEDKMYHAPDDAGSGRIRVVTGELFVTTPGTGLADETIQRAVDVADAGDLVNVESGTFNENVTIGKDIDILGDAGGGTVVQAVGAGNTFTIQGTGTFGTADDEVTLDFINLDGLTTGSYGVRIDGNADLASFSLMNADVSHFRQNGFFVAGSSTTAALVGNVTLSDLTFGDNGIAGGGGSGDIQFFGFNNNAALANLALVGNRNEGAGTGARLGIQFRGVGAGDGVSEMPMGTVSLDNVDVSGMYRTQMIGIQRYSDVNNLSFNDVALGGAGSEITGGFGASLRFDGVGSGTVTAPQTFDLANTAFRGLDPTSAQRHEIEFAPDNAFAFLRVDGTSTTWSGIAAGSLTLNEAFDVEDRVLHYVDKLNPVHGLTFGAYKGFVDIQANHAFITDSPDSGVIGDGSITRGVEVVALGGTVNVESGEYFEDVVVDRSVTVLGDNLPIVHPVDDNDFASVVIEITADDVTIDGLNVVVDRDDASGGIAASNVAQPDVNMSGGSFANLVLQNNVVESQGDNVGSFDLVGGLPASAMGIALIANGGTVHSVTLTNNQSVGTQTATVDPTNPFGVSSFTRGIYLGQVMANVTGNTASGIAQDLLVQFASGGTTTIDQNIFLGAGVDISAPNANSPVNITGNSFEPAVVVPGFPPQSLLVRFATDPTSPVTIGGAGGLANTFDDFNFGIVLESSNASILNNTFANVDNGTGPLDPPNDVDFVGSGTAAIWVQAGSAAFIDGNAINGGGIVTGIEIDGGTALVQNNDLTGNAIGVRIQNDGVADLGDVVSDRNVTGMGSSTGGNDFSGYTTSSPTTGAIVNLNADVVAGPQGAPPDVPAVGNTFDASLTTPALIEDAIYHDVDDNNLGFVEATIVATVTASIDAAEPAMNGLFTVDLGAVNNTGGPITVSYMVAGTATPGSDYTMLTGTVDVPDGQQTAEIDVLVMDDVFVEGPETVVVTLTGTSNVNVGVDATSDTVTIDDNDTSVVSLMGPNDVNEGAVALYPIDITGSIQVGETITFDIQLTSTEATLDLTAPPSDFAGFTYNGMSSAGTTPVVVNVTNGTFTITPSMSTLGLATIEYTATNTGTVDTLNVGLDTFNDTAVEGPEDYTIAISNLTSTADPQVSIDTGNDDVTTTIIDNDTSVVSLMDPNDVNEGAVALYPIDITGSIQVGETITFDIQLTSTEATLDLTAPPSDFAGFTYNGMSSAGTTPVVVNVTNGTFTITPSMSTLGLATIEYTATNTGTVDTLNVGLDTFNDTAVEGPEDYTIAISNLTSTADPQVSIDTGNDDVTTTIIDNDTSVVSLMGPNDVNEGAVALYPIDITGSIQFGETITFDIQLTSTEATLDLTAPPSDFAGYTYNGMSSAGTTPVVVNVTNGTFTITPSMSTLGLATIEYTATNTGTVDTLNVGLDTFNDTAVEGPEDYTIAISNLTSTADPQVSIDTGNDYVTTTIIDNDTATWTLTQTGAQAADGVDEGDAAIYTLGLNGAVQIGRTATIDVDLTLLGPTSLPDFAESLAEALQDAVDAYNGSTAGDPNTFSLSGTGSSVTVTFHGDSTVTPSLSIDLSTFDDTNMSQTGHLANLVEPNEDFQLAISNPGGTASPQVLNGTASPVDTTINDDDSAEVRIEPFQQASENPVGVGTDGVFRVFATNPSQTSYSVNFSDGTNPGTASPALDYVALLGTGLNFGPGETQKFISIDTIDDVLVEDLETVTVELTGFTNPVLVDPEISIAAPPDNQATLTITDNDSATIAISNVTLDEGDAGTTAFTFDITIDTPVDIVVTLQADSADGTATLADNDYAALVAAPVSFAAESTATQQVTVQVNGDTTVELDEAFNVLLSNLMAGGRDVTIGTPTGTGMITNDDSATIAINNVMLDEGDSGTTAFTFDITIDNPVDVAVSLQADSSDGTATLADNDYVALVAEPVSFAANSTTTQQITVQVIGDTAFEPDEVFDVVLSNLMAGGRSVTFGTGTGTGTIINDDVVDCDFDDDGDCDIDDIDALVAEIVSGSNDPAFDLTDDGAVDLDDRDQWLVDAGALNLPSGNAYLLGDSNLDGTVDGQDFIVWNNNKFQPTGLWSLGDWNADGTTDGQDFILWNNNKFLSADDGEPVVDRVFASLFAVDDEQVWR